MTPRAHGATCARIIAPTAMTSLPHFRHDAHAGAVRLIVDGEPFLILGGELGNSTASSAAALDPVWSTLRQLNLNTVLAPVYWELIEPEEGRFDFSLVDHLIASARRNEMRLVLLWFGVWKNSMSTYVPAWVKRDGARFPHARDQRGRPVEILSAFGEATLAADVAAYVGLLRHLRETDGDDHTVLMVQIENEIGFLPDAREHGSLADAAWGQPVPAALTEHLRQHRDALEPELRALWGEHGARASGSWADVFGHGPAAQEVFTAWHYARFVEALAARGKQVYPLPVFVNAALNRPGRAPGAYPSGGPLPHLLDVWRAAAPSLDMLSPDVYFFDFAKWTARYCRPGNPLFVPEAIRSSRAPANAMTAIAGQGAIGFSPFGIEATRGPDADALAHTYAALRHLAPLLTGRAPAAAIVAASPAVNHDGTMDPAPQVVTVGPYRLTVAFDGAADAMTTAAAAPPAVTADPATRGGALPRSGGMICFTAPDDYTIVGAGLTVTHAAADDSGDAVGLLDVEEWRVDDFGGAWRPFRRLNGDQTHQGRHVRLDSERIRMQTVRLYRFR
jgi:beta-galactosidase GanA